MANDDIPLPRQDPRTAQTRFRQIEGDIAERNAPRPDVTPGAFAPPDPMTVAPALESDQLKAYGLGRVIRGEER